MMKKFLVFRSFGNLEKDVRKHELVVVEHGANIYAVTDALVKAVRDDATGIEEYQSYEVEVYAPEPVPSGRRVKRYAYSIMAVASPANGKLGDIIEYGVIEEEVREAQ